MTGRPFRVGGDSHGGTGYRGGKYRRENGVARAFFRLSRAPAGVHSLKSPDGSGHTGDRLRTLTSVPESAWCMTVNCGRMYC